MNIEFHYHVTYILARKSGFDREDASVIAYSSQYTDDNTFQYYVNYPNGNDFITRASQTMDITKPSLKKEKIYPLFHFFPGDPAFPAAARTDGTTHPFNTTPDSDNVRYIFSAALETKNLYRIGIATHVYADTWAHQNFLGLNHHFNALRTPVGQLIPDVGHADALHEPDIVGNRWKDTRLVAAYADIDNNMRFLDAAEKIYFAFKKYNNHEVTDDTLSTDWNSLRKKLEKAMNTSSILGSIFNSSQKARIKAYNAICDDIPAYDENEWRRAALEKREMEVDLFDRYWARAHYPDSHWHRFQEAIREHYLLSLEHLAPLYEELKV
jgi:hypothetical protein